MSKGLSYLSVKRPEAMAGLLKFYGKSVKALDDKTRLLISIVTKVATGTERGLRQYAPQAIAAGASKEELLDAVLMAFPAAGLTKVVDAVQILLGMDLLPALDHKEEVSASNKLDLGTADQFAVGQVSFVATVHGKVIVYHKKDDMFSLYSAKCPHAKGDLSLGVCTKGTIECPVHHWQFNLANGKNIKSRLAGLASIPFELRDNHLVAIVEHANSDQGQ